MGWNIKYGRGYNLTIQLPAGINADLSIANQSTLTVELPFTIEFDVVRQSYSDTNSATIRIYNLSLEHRNLLRYDQQSQSTLPENMLQVQLQAGYGPGPNWPIIFKGVVTRGWSKREGTNFITQLECFDGGNAIKNALVNPNNVFAAGTTQNEVIATILSDLDVYNIQIGAVSDFPGTLSRGNSYTGPAAEVLSQLTNGNFFIDNEIAHALLPTDAIGTEGSPFVISAATGLLGTPLLENKYIAFDILFEPRVKIGMLIDLQSSTAQIYNGLYKIASIHHKGTISASVSGEAVTTIGMLQGVYQQILVGAGL